MNMRRYVLRWSLVIIVILAVIGLFALGVHRLHFDTDIMTSLPQSDPVLADARYIIMHHPIHDRVVIDIEHAGGDMDTLVEGANLVEAKMRQSGLFKEVGIRHIGQLLPELIRHIIDHLPVLFSQEELEEDVRPLLDARKCSAVPAKKFNFPVSSRGDRPDRPHLSRSSRAAKSRACPACRLSHRQKEHGSIKVISSLQTGSIF